MTFPQMIATRRDGGIHTEEELRYLADGAAQGTIPDYQLAAWLMAAYLKPLTPQETALLTVAMADSGERIDLTGLPHPWVDKHSTGGVGDKTSIVLLPLLAACGLTVIKMSGRGLGITGGTVDKLASIPGFQLDLTPEQMKEQAQLIGLALTGQSPNLAPADKTLYALRDVTETVSSIPLIVSSILSKKLAGGAEVVVLDVKCGSGAFMRTLQAAEELAGALAQTAKLCGLKTRIVITDMSEPLGAAIGNALEIIEAFQVLQPEPPDLGTPSRRFRDLCIELAAITLEAAGQFKDLTSARERVKQAFSSGEAKRKASEWIIAQGGADPFGEHMTLPHAPVVKVGRSTTDGFVLKLDAETVGKAVLELGGGRVRKDAEIDHSVGVVLLNSVGSAVKSGEPLFEVHAASENQAEQAVRQVMAAYEISAKSSAIVPPILSLI